MKQKQVRPIRRGGFPTIFSAVLLTALTLGSIGQAAPLSQTPLAQNPNDHYEM